MGTLQGPPKLPGSAALLSVTYLLEPLVRLLVAQGVTYTALAAALKAVFVNVAIKQAPAGKKMTDSQISISTAVHRKDVRRLRQEAKSRAALMKEPVSLVAAVFTRWTTDPAWSDASGPRPLKRHGDDSFESLVKELSTDVHSRTVCDEFMRLGLLDADADTVRLRFDFLVPREDQDQMLRYMAGSLHDHAAAAVANVLRDGAPSLEQSVFSDAIPSNAVPAIEALAREAWRVVMQKAVPELIRHEAAGQAGIAGMPATPATSLSRVRIGMFFYAEKNQGVARDAPART
ncbi:MAG: hypothetical protein JWR21_1662 [Herminiimonas sp.]|nr:hypothetical protein [Herminiimonas sp.]